MRKQLSSLFFGFFLGFSIVLVVEANAESLKDDLQKSGSALGSGFLEIYDNTNTNLLSSEEISIELEFSENSLQFLLCC